MILKKMSFKQKKIIAFLINQILAKTFLVSVKTFTTIPILPFIPNLIFMWKKMSSEIVDNKNFFGDNFNNEKITAIAQGVVRNFLSASVLMQNRILM